ncbi:MAG: cytidylate kinase-like family protein [Clostridia bacterium]|nr:cytidylate kinase-like family protein [Clostridia bacterium]
MKIITVSREFGSGGRELGKRLADELGFDYYDREIITAISKNCELDEKYVEASLENNVWQQIPLTFGSSFISLPVFQSSKTNLLLEQKKVLESIARSGRDCIIVGRNADIILEEYAPFNIFVCAEMLSRVSRCFDRATDREKSFSEKEMISKIKSIDKCRRETRALISDIPWGDPHHYHLTVNTTGMDIRSLVPAVAQYIRSSFGSREK